MQTYLQQIITLFGHFLVPDPVMAKVVQIVNLMQEKIDDLSHDNDRLRKDTAEYAEQVHNLKYDLSYQESLTRAARKNERNGINLIVRFLFNTKYDTLVNYIANTGNSIQYHDGNINKITVIKGIRKYLMDNNLPNSLAGCKDAVEDFIRENPDHTLIEDVSALAPDAALQALREKLTGGSNSTD